MVTETVGEKGGMVVAIGVSDVSKWTERVLGVATGGRCYGRTCRIMTDTPELLYTIL